MKEDVLRFLDAGSRKMELLPIIKIDARKGLKSSELTFSNG